MSDHVSPDELLTQATCAVLISDEESQEDQVIGTAWLFSDQGHLLTAGHLLGTEPPLFEVRVQFASEPPQVVEVIHWAFEAEQKIDFAILKLADGAGTRRALPVRLARFIEGRCRLYGYGKSLEGLTGGAAEYIGTFGDEHNRLFRLESKALAEEGFSGGALFSEELKAVVAIQTEKGRGRFGPTQDTIFCLPLYRMAECWPPLRELIGWKVLSEHDPYVGLQTFTQEDADLFYGRGTMIDKMINKVSDSPFLAVLGPSGSGKSSVVRAGLLPALKNDALPDSSEWLYLIIKPNDRPLDTLAAALNKSQGGDLGELADLRRMLSDNERALLLAADMARAENPEARLVLVIDQFEELWTLAPSEPDAYADFVAEKQKPFIDLLLTAIEEQNEVNEPSVLIIFTMRADFLHYAAEHRDLADVITEGVEIVSAMQPDELQQAIAEPLKHVDGKFEKGLVDELIKQSSEREGALPLLQYTLDELWQAAEPNMYGTPTMTWDAFHALGGVEGALAKRADDILQQEYDATEQEQLRHLLVRLVQPGEGTADTRRRLFLEELVPAGENLEKVQALLDPLVKNRLLTTGHDRSTGQQTVEISHEALIRAWPTLSEWINEARQTLYFQLQLEEAAKEWQTHDEDMAYLWRDLRLANAEAWLERAQPQLNQRDLSFLQASRDADARRVARKEAAEQEREQLLEARVVAEETAREEAEKRVAAEKEKRQEVERRVAAEKEKRKEKRRTWFLVFLLLLIASVGAGYLLNDELQAQEQQAIAQAQVKAWKALFELSNQDHDRARLLALAAVRPDVEPSQLVSRALRKTLEETVIEQQLVGHTDQVVSVAFSPNGRQVLMGSSNDGTARLWDLQTGQVITLTEHSGPVVSVAFSPNGDHLLTGSGSEARLWNAQTGELIEPLLEHTLPVHSVTFSPNGENLLTASGSEVHLWNVQTGQVMNSLREHIADVTSVVFSPTGQQVLTGSKDHTARLWNVQTGEVISLTEHERPVTSVAFSPKGEQVLTGSSDGTVYLWNVKTGEGSNILKEHTRPVKSLVFSEDGKQVLTGSSDRTARLWNLETGKVTDILEGHAAPVLSVAFSKDNKQMLTGSGHTVRVWIVDHELLVAELTEQVCDVWQHDEEHINAEISGWEGCEAELDAVKEELVRYNELRGENISSSQD